MTPMMSDEAQIALNMMIKAGICLDLADAVRQGYFEKGPAVQSNYLDEEN